MSRIRGRPRDIYWKSTESGSNVILGRSSYDVIDADYDVYSVLSRWQLTLTDDSLARSLQCVVKTHDNVMLRKDVHLVGTLKCHHNDVIWSSWRLKSPGTWLIVRKLIRVNWKTTLTPAQPAPCKGNSPVIGGFPSQRASNPASLP